MTRLSESVGRILSRAGIIPKDGDKTLEESRKKREEIREEIEQVERQGESKVKSAQEVLDIIKVTVKEEPLTLNKFMRAMRPKDGEGRRGDVDK